jgi:hypothetical protein
VPKLRQALDAATGARSELIRINERRAIASAELDAIEVERCEIAVAAALG